MALFDGDVQIFLGSEDGERSRFRSQSGSVGRASIDGCLVIYDLDDIPAWLAKVLVAQDEDGHTELAEPRCTELELHAGV